MPQPDLIITPFAQDAPPSAVDPIPETRSPSDPLEKATWRDGFPSLTMIPLAAGGIPPRGQDFNGVLKAISEHTVFLEGGGQYKWSDEFVAANGGYPKGAVVQSDDGLTSYVSAIDANTINFNTSPESIGVEWIPAIMGLVPSAEVEAGTSTRLWAWSVQRVFQAIRSAAANATEMLRGSLRVGTQLEVDAGALDDVAVTPNKLRHGFSASFTVNGYLFLPSWLGGFGVQWGYDTNTVAQKTITYPIAFPTACFGVLAIGDTTLAAGHGAVAIVGTSAGDTPLVSFTCINTGYNGLALPRSNRWLAWGK